MSGHPLCASTLTLELLQVSQLNERLTATAGSTGSGPTITALDLELAEARVVAGVLDRAVSHLVPAPRSGSTVLPGAAVLASVLAVGAPSFPYLYGVFTGSAGGAAHLPALLHTRQLQVLSQLLRLTHHQWGV